MGQQETDIFIGPPKDDAEVAEFTRIIAQSLFFATIDHDEFIKLEGRENITVARLGDKVTGGLIVQPLGISFGGRSVPMAGVRAVGVAPEYRSKGIGAELMDSVVRDCYTKGLALSVLFPATLSVYRHAGYELAGSRTTYRYAMGTIGKQARTLDIREATTADKSILEDLYRKRFVRSPGNVDRTDWAWRRFLDPSSWWSKTYGYIVEQDGTPAGYIYFAQKSGVNIIDNTISIVDWSWESADAGRALLSMLADHRSMTVAFDFPGAPADPLMLLMNESAIEKITRFDWMLRVVDVKRAIESRGYLASTRAELHLEIADPLIEENSGKFILSVADGRASLTKGGVGRLSASIRDFAPLYSGFMSAESLRAASRLAGDDESIATASRIFAGRIPWMSDMF